MLVTHGITTQPSFLLYQVDNLRAGDIRSRTRNEWQHVCHWLAPDERIRQGVFKL